jgi:hypothetical protein
VSSFSGVLPKSRSEYLYVSIQTWPIFECDRSEAQHVREAGMERCAMQTIRFRSTNLLIVSCFNAG